MNLHLIVIVGFVVLVALFVTAIFLYSSLNRQHDASNTTFRLRPNRDKDSSVRREDCRG
jgi:hypothetical protein